MRPDFILKEQFRAWLKRTELNKVAAFDGVLAGSYVDRMGRLERPFKSIDKRYRLIDLVARARAESHAIEPAPNSKFERDQVLKSCEELKADMHLLEVRKSELEEQVYSAERLTKIMGSSKALTGATMLTEDEIVNGSDVLADCCGVYFLIRLGKVVYVGQSVNVHSRISGHVGSKKFDKFAYVQCKRSALDVIESLYIHVLRPPLNGIQGGVPCAPIRLDRLVTLATAKTNASN